MALTFADGRYTDTADGSTYDDHTLTVYRDAQIDRWAEELRLLADLLTAPPHTAIDFPGARVAMFADRFLNRSQDILTSAFVFAAGGVDMVKAAAMGSLLRLVTRQADYGQQFVAAIRSGSLAPADIGPRAAMYAGAAAGAFEEGKAQLRGFRPPMIPGEDCSGMANCRCYWEITTFVDRIEGIWHAVGDKATCEHCNRHADEWAPLIQPLSP